MRVIYGVYTDRQRALKTSDTVYTFNVKTHLLTLSGFYFFSCAHFTGGLNLCRHRKGTKIARVASVCALPELGDRDLSVTSSVI